MRRAQGNNLASERRAIGDVNGYTDRMRTMTTFPLFLILACGSTPGDPFTDFPDSGVVTPPDTGNAREQRPDGASGGAGPVYDAGDSGANPWPGTVGCFPLSLHDIRDGFSCAPICGGAKQCAATLVWHAPAVVDDVADIRDGCELGTRDPVLPSRPSARSGELPCEPLEVAYFEGVEDQDDVRTWVRCECMEE